MHPIHGVVLQLNWCCEMRYVWPAHCVLYCVFARESLCAREWNPYCFNISAAAVDIAAAAAAAAAVDIALEN